MPPRSSIDWIFLRKKWLCWDAEPALFIKVTLFSLPEVFCGPQICQKCVGGRGSARWRSSRRSPRSRSRLGRNTPLSSSQLLGASILALSALSFCAPQCKRPCCLALGHPWSDSCQLCVWSWSSMPVVAYKSHILRYQRILLRVSLSPSWHFELASSDGLSSNRHCSDDRLSWQPVD